MKRMLCCSMVAVLVLASACVSSAPRTSSPMAQRREGVAPHIIIGSTLTGTGGSGERAYSVSYTFNEDGSLVVVKNGIEFSGAWEFDKAKDFMPYTISWEENGEPQGYLVTMSIEGDTISLMGHWYITDMYKTLSETLKK